MKKLILFLALILLTGCSSTKFYVTDDGFKVAENGSRLQESDFDGSNFFLKNPSNQYYFDLNRFAFFMISEYLISNHVARPANKPQISNKLQKKGEAVLLRNGEAYFVRYDDDKEEYDTYSYIVRIDDAAYNKYCQYINEYVSKRRNASDCQWVIDNCINPVKTITRQVSVPRTAYRNVSRSADTYYSGNIYGRSTTYYTSVEPYTVYDTKTEYLTVANPNYDPVKVEQAREMLTGLLAEIDNLDKLIREVAPMVLLILDMEEAASYHITDIGNSIGNLLPVMLVRADCH